MSRIYFHSPSGDAEVPGTERAWMGCLTDDLGMATVDGFMIRRLMEWATVRFPYGESAAAIQRDRDLADMFRLYAKHITGHDALLSFQGREITTWDLTLNTCLRVGSPAVQLAARLHAQCEIHCWVDGPNRRWLADLIGAGLKAGTFRRTSDTITDWKGDPTGWTAVQDLLRARDDEPVVCSYSVCEQFPNAEASTWMPAWPDGVPEKWDALTEGQQQERSARREAWYELPDAEKWRLGMEHLRGGTGHLELVPDQFGDGYYHFGHGLSWLDIEASDAEARVRKAFALTVEVQGVQP